MLTSIISYNDKIRINNEYFLKYTLVYICNVLYIRYLIWNTKVNVRAVYICNLHF